MVEEVTRIEKSLFVVVLILLFQITRHISTVTYVGVLFAAYLYLYASLLVRRQPIDISFSKALFLLSFAWIPVVSMLNLEVNEYFVALPRFLVVVPFIIFCTLYTSYSKNIIKSVLQAFVAFMALAALSMPYQIAFGEISFLVDPSYREGLVRFGSLAGSLTNLGSLGTYALAILLFSGSLLFRKSHSIMLILIIIMGMLLTLQKAAIANILLVFLLYVVLLAEGSLWKRILVVSISVALVFAIYMNVFGTQASFYLQALLRTTFDNPYHGLQADFTARLWRLPAQVIYFHDMSLLNVVFGIGLGALSGTLGLPSLPMAHNNYFDLFFSGGVLHAVMYMYFLLQIPLGILAKKLQKRQIHQIDRVYLAIAILILANMLIGASSLYQPISAVVTFFAIFSYKRAVFLFRPESATDKGFPILQN